MGMHWMLHIISGVRTAVMNWDLMTLFIRQATVCMSGDIADYLVRSNQLQLDELGISLEPVHACTNVYSLQLPLNSRGEETNESVIIDYSRCSTIQNICTRTVWTQKNWHRLWQLEPTINSKCGPYAAQEFSVHTGLQTELSSAANSLLLWAAARLKTTVGLQ